MLTGKIFNLNSLSADHPMSVIDLFVDKLLVLDVNQWAEEDDASAKKTQTPNWKDLHQVVGDERRSKSL